MFKFFADFPFEKNGFERLEFVAIDVETTGLFPQSDRITEIGAIRFTSKEMIDRFEELIDPCYPISSEASRVSGITQSMVLGKQKINETLPVFLEFIKNAVLIAHNAKFDCAFLASELDRASLPYFTNIVLDTKLIAKRVWKNLPGYGLERLLAELSLPHGRLHRALNDAEACRDIFLISLKKIQETADLTFSLLGGTAFIMEANHT